MFNVTLLGASFETGNMGVSALAASLVKLIKNISPEANISFFIASQSAKTTKIEIGNRLVDIDIINYRLSPKASIEEHLFWLFFVACFYRIIPFHTIKKMIVQSNWRIKSLALSNFVGDIRGGDSFSDIYGIKGLIMGSIPSIIALLLGKKLVLLPQTYGPYQSKLAKQIANLILKRASFIISRDRESIEIVNHILDKGTKMKSTFFCPDVAFVLDPSTEKTPNIYPPLNISNSSSIIGFNISGLLYNGGFTRQNMFGLKLDYKQFVHRLSEHLLQNTTASLLFIPHTFAPDGHVESDPEACHDVFKKLSDSYTSRLHVASGEYNQSTIKWIIGLCDFFIGSRMHACIAALSQGIPTVGIAYSRKFKGVFDSIEFGQFVIDARVADVEESISRVLLVYEKRKQMEQILKRQIEIANDRLYHVFQEILRSE